MKSEAFFVIAFIVLILVLVNAVIKLITPAIDHYWQKYQHYRIVEERRRQFYSELKILMAN